MAHVTIHFVEKEKSDATKKTAPRMAHVAFYFVVTVLNCQKCHNLIIMAHTWVGQVMVKVKP